jgi:hypothetical protein
MALTLAAFACAGEKRAAQSPAPPTPAAAAAPAVAVDSPSLRPFQQKGDPLGPWGFRRADGSVAIEPRFAWAGPFAEGLAPVYGDSSRWGYIDTTGALVIPARFSGAGDFRGGRAPVQDTGGYALIDRGGRIVERFRADSAARGPGLVDPPSDTCSSINSYVAELSRGAQPARFAIYLEPRPIETEGAALVSRLHNGVLVIDEHEDDGFSLQVVLPGVSEEQAHAWLLRIRHGKPLDAGDGCEEHWTSKSVRGGALLLDSGGC